MSFMAHVAHIKRRELYRLRMLGILLAGLILLTLQVCAQGSPKKPHRSDCARWYPMAVGNDWTYQTKEIETGRLSKLRWEVRQLTKDGEKDVFVIWPTPLTSDDSQLWLASSESGIQETDTEEKALLVRCPPKAGDAWNYERHSVLKNRKVKRSFRVLSLGNRCAVQHIQFSSCLVIEEYDEEFQQRVVTTYALDVGPVRIEYYKFGAPGTEPRHVQTDELIEYQLQAKKKVPQF